MPKFQCSINAGCRHRGLQARLEGNRVRMLDDPEAIMALTVAFVVKREGHTAMERRPFLIRVALCRGVDRIGKLVVLDEKLKRRIQQRAKIILAIGCQQSGDVGG
jgi:hypothetical protein